MEINQNETQETSKAKPWAEENPLRHLVTPGSLNQCVAVWGENRARVLDISFVRVVLGEMGDWPVLMEEQVIPVLFSMNGFEFAAELKIQGRGDGWLRFSFEKLVPSAKSYLRSFLAPKKVGESMLEDKQGTEVRHYHGLNESELWFDKRGNVLFTHLDYLDSRYQFIVQAKLESQTLNVGRLTRHEYMNLPSIDGELGLIPLNDKENYSRMSECRDVITNFRATGQLEFHLKQKLLKLISDNLYSTGHRVDFHMVRPIRLH